MDKILFDIFIVVAAPFIAAIVAVCVGQWLQNKAVRREDKINILKAFVGHRGELRDAWLKQMPEEITRKFVLSYNLIPIVFYKSKKVMKALEEYKNTFPDESRDKIKDAIGWFTGENKSMINKYQNALEKLIRVMAKEVGYRKIDFSL